MSELLKSITSPNTVIAYPKTIQFGPVELDGYMLETGEFRQSLRSTAAALGTTHHFVGRRVAEICGSACGKPGLLTQGGPSDTNGSGEVPPLNRTRAEPSQGLTSSISGSGSEEQAVIIPVRTNLSGNFRAMSINLPMVVEIWKRIAMEGGPHSRQALELLGLSAVHSLERTYQEAFGVADARSTQDRLMDWAIRLDAGKHFPLFGGKFHKEFARVTGVAIGHRYAQVCLAELVYHRLPPEIYETLKDINPADERGWRQFTHSQLMTDQMRTHMQGIVLAVTSQLASSPSKAENPKGYRDCLKRLDKTLPRYKTRGHFGKALDAA